MGSTKSLFWKMGVLFESIFASVRNTKSGSKYKSVIVIFGMFICHSFFCFVHFHLTNSDSYLTASLHHLMGFYSNLINKNWSYYATKTTKVKKPYLEKLIFRNLQADLIPLLGLVGLFPKLNDANVIPQLQLFHLYYTKPGNKQKETRVIAK